MWFYKCFSFGYLIFLVLVFCEDNMKQHKKNKKQLNVEFKIFKNITEANKTLQELINNFKQLQKIYKNYESSGSHSSESEIDEVFKQISNDNKYNEEHLRKQSFTTNDPSNHYRGTAYIYEYQESGVPGGEEAKDEREKLINAKEEKTEQESSLENDAKTKTSSENISGSDEVEPKTEPEEEEVVEIKIDSTKNYESLASKPKKSLFNIPENYPSNQGKTRFSVLKSGKDNINDIRNKSEIPSKIGNQRIVYSEQFLPETIWDDIINRPIKLNRVITSEETFKLNSRENEKKSAVITNKKKKEETTKIFDDLETRELLNIATDVNFTLRNGYGEECIQLPIKKCKKALKIVNKNVCKRRFKCESDFKSDFDENSIKECVKKFSYSNSVNNEVKYNISRNTKDDNQFRDATRYRPHKIIFNNKSDLTLQENSRNRLILLSLRDKYEKKCQKESREKCIAACNDATETTCLKHTCDKKKKKALTKACKEECKNIFVIDNKSNESSESSEESSSSDSESG